MDFKSLGLDNMDVREAYKILFGRPNFLIIHTDQQRADCINAYQIRQHLYTPNQDSMAAMGARFNACYAACPMCIPQRLSFMTGQSPQKHGVYDNVGIPDLEFEATLQGEMNKAGYRTALIGRTMHTYPFSNDYGFQDYIPGDPTSNEPDKDGFLQFIEKYGPAGNGGYGGNGTLLNSHFAAPFHMDNAFHQTMWATNKAIEYIEDRKKDKQPFMLCLGYFAPHSPHNPPREWMDYYMSLDLKDDPAIADYDIPPVSNGHPISPYIKLEGDELKRVRAAYYGNISFIDAQLGRVINSIMEMMNTYVIFTSDHGEMLGDHFHMHKHMPYQGAVHTPFMIYGPGIAGNQVIETPITWQDIMPTVLDLAGVPVPPSVDGLSFADSLLGKTDQKEREYVHGESKVSRIDFGGYETQIKENNIAFENGFHYLTDGKMKYIWYNASGREQLFDLKKDYQELHDLSGKDEYQAEMDKWRKIMIKELKDRPEGFSDGERLICTEENQLSPTMERVCAERIAQGKKVAYYIPKNISELKQATL